MSNKHLAKGSKMPVAAKGKIRLYSNRFCPYSQRIHLILDAKKLQYDTVFINITSKPEWYLQKNPSGRVPALEVENGEILYESIIIANYLDEKYPHNTLHHKDPLQKAKDLLLIDQFNKAISSMNKMLLTSGRSVEEQEETISESLNLFENELGKRGNYYGGSKPGMIDYMIWPWVERADLLKLFGNKFSMKKDRYKKLMEWRNAMMEDNAVKKTYLDSSIHVKFLQSFRAGVSEYDLILSQM